MVWVVTYSIGFPSYGRGGDRGGSRQSALRNTFRRAYPRPGAFISLGLCGGWQMLSIATDQEHSYVYTTPVCSRARGRRKCPSDEILITSRFRDESIHAGLLVPSSIDGTGTKKIDTNQARKHNAKPTQRTNVTHTRPENLAVSPPKAQHKATSTVHMTRSTVYIFVILHFFYTFG